MINIKGVVTFNKIDSTACYILLINPEKIPHLVYIQKGKYYSLTFKDSIIGEPFQPYFKKLVRLKKKMIFLKLNLNNRNASEEFNKYGSADSSNVTCFVPIKDLLLPDSQAEMIHELIPELYLNNIIQEASHLNIGTELNSSGDFPLSVYTKKMIFSYIQHLKIKDASRK